MLQRRRERITQRGNLIRIQAVKSGERLLGPSKLQGQLLQGLRAGYGTSRCGVLHERFLHLM